MIPSLVNIRTNQEPSEMNSVTGSQLVDAWRIFEFAELCAWYANIC